jgi:hypothetical protein
MRLPQQVYRARTADLAWVDYSVFFFSLPVVVSAFVLDETANETSFLFWLLLVGVGVDVDVS